MQWSGPLHHQRRQHGWLLSLASGTTWGREGGREGWGEGRKGRGRGRGEGREGDWREGGGKHDLLSILYQDRPPVHTVSFLFKELEYTTFSIAVKESCMGLTMLIWRGFSATSVPSSLNDWNKPAASWRSSPVSVCVCVCVCVCTTSTSKHYEPVLANSWSQFASTGS